MEDAGPLSALLMCMLTRACVERFYSQIPLLFHVLARMRSRTSFSLVRPGLPFLSQTGGRSTRCEPHTIDPLWMIAGNENRSPDTRPLPTIAVHALERATPTNKPRHLRSAGTGRWVLLGSCAFLPSSTNQGIPRASWSSICL